MRSQCTVRFEDPFWVGFFELWDDTVYSVCRIVFGKEPKISERNEWMLANYSKIPYKQQQMEELPKSQKINPKKLKKQIAREVSGKYQGTKAQQALKSLHEEEKVVRKKVSREQKEEMLQRRFEQKQEKKKQKKRGH